MIPLEQLRESSIYQLILQEGKTEGRQEGREEGLEHERTLIARQLRRKFGALAAEAEAQVRTLSRERIERLAEDLFDLPDADALADWLERAD
jgi:predicted transposase YdaD